MELPDPNWLPLRRGIVVLGLKPEWWDGQCKQISRQYPGVTLAYSSHTEQFGISVHRITADGLTGYEVAHGVFRVGEDFRGELSELNEKEEAALCDVMQALAFRLQKRVQLAAGIDFDVHARIGSALAEKFSRISPDAARSLRVLDWENGVADTRSGEKLFSIHLIGGIAASSPSGAATVIGGDSDPSRKPSALAKVSRRGRPAKWPWDRAKEKCFEILDHHGAPTEEDPELKNLAALELRIKDYFDPGNAGNHPVESDIREHVSGWLREWKNSKEAGK